MNTPFKTAFLAAAAVAMAASAQAQYNANDLLLGIRTDTAANDFILNLGNANTSVGANGSLGPVVNLSSLLASGDLSSFGSSFQMGVVGGQPLTSGRDVYTTVLRTALGTPASASSSLPSGPLGSSTIGNGVSDIAGFDNNLGLTAGQKGTISRTDASSWSSLIAPGTGNSGQFINDTGLNPMATATGSVILEDLYRAVPNGSFNYLGYFTLNNSGASPQLSFTVVPEPFTYAILVIGGVAFLIFGRRPRSKQQAC